MASAFTEPGRRVSRAAGWALLALLVPASTRGDSPSSAAEASTEARRLSQVRREIERLQALLDQGRREEKSLLGELHNLDLDLALHRRQVQLLEADLARTRRQIEETGDRVARTRSRLESDRVRLGARLRALYISGPPAFEKAVLTSADAGEVVGAYRAVSRVAQADAFRVQVCKFDLARLGNALQDLEAQKASLASLRTQTVNRRNELERARGERSRLLAGVHQEVSEQQGALTEMAQTAEALQKLAEALAAGREVSPELKVPFPKFRGTLPWPVPGKILASFGAQKSSRFDTQVPHPGVDLAVAVGESVRSVFDGVAAYSDWFKGYGNMIIVEHGDGFMSVYAHLSERLVAAGERVEGGQVIGRAGDTGSLEGPKLYFEILRDGKPENPVAWLTRR